MISNQFKCIFVHVPKTAGQSVELFFLNLLQLTWKQKDQLYIKKNSDPQCGPSRLAHLTASEYVDCGHIDQSTFDSYFKFAFVRNPWERLVSEYLHKKIDRKMSLKEFVFNGLPVKNNFCDKYRHIIPQYNYLFDSQGKQLVDFIGRFENLQHDFDWVCQQLNIAQSELPHRNSSFSPRRLLLRKLRHLFSSNNRIKKHYTEYYDNELHDYVAKMYEVDIAQFNYSFSNKDFITSTVNHNNARLSDRILMQDS
ncbi:sulfotransferase family 2 domain-containing protein [Aliikangiella maris]|uniref:Sulfotransferase family 2 domain-containing protein n=2 Tax=Aliikangiella maris TaxID=3162458 RepID=A0ABV3MLD1_9GAMM